MSEPDANVTRLLRAAATGDRGDIDALLAAIYDDLRRLAARQMQGERDDHTLQPTAVVHEAYLKLVDQHSTDWRDRLHFFAVASRIIRRILVDHARAKRTAKRGSGRNRVPIDSVHIGAGVSDIDIIALDEAMEALDRIDPRQAKIVELRFFGGLTVPEVAEYLSIGQRSVDRDWRCAKAWLYCRLTDEEAEAADA